MTPNVFERVLEGFCPNDTIGVNTHLDENGHCKMCDNYYLAKTTESGELIVIMVHGAPGSARRIEQGVPTIIHLKKPVAQPRNFNPFSKWEEEFTKQVINEVAPISSSTNRARGFPGSGSAGGRDFRES